MATYGLAADVILGALIAYREQLNEAPVFVRNRNTFETIDLLTSMEITLPAEQMPSPCLQLNYALNRMRFFETCAQIDERMNRPVEVAKSREQVARWTAYFNDETRQKLANDQEEDRVARAEDADLSRLDQD